MNTILLAAQYMDKWAIVASHGSLFHILEHLTKKKLRSDFGKWDREIAIANS